MSVGYASLSDELEIYGFLGADTQEIKYTLIDLERKQEIEPKTYLSFFVEFSYVEGASEEYKGLIESLITGN